MLSRARLFFILNLIFLGIICFKSLDPNAFVKAPAPGSLAFYQGERLEFIGFVCEEADVNYKSRRLSVCASDYRHDKVLITTSLYPEYDYGDFLIIKGLLQAPPILEGFDYARYLGRYGIASVMYYPRLEKVGAKAGAPELSSFSELSSSSALGLFPDSQLSFRQKIYLQLLKAKWFLKKTMEKSLPEPEAGLAVALLLGYRRTILAEDAEVFARTGLSHLIAISGSHITIMSAMLVGALLFFGASRRQSLRGVFVFLAIYPLITGLSASAVRSAIMGGLMFLALYYGRLSSAINALIFSAALMLVFNPRLLRDDIGFQLSFAAVLGIIYIYPLGSSLSSRIKRWTTRGASTYRRRAGKLFLIFWEIFSLTFACQLAVTPIMLANFQQFSLVSFIANPVIAWIFPLLLGALILPLLPAALCSALGPWFFAPAYFLLALLFKTARFFSGLSWAASEVSNFSAGATIIYYSILISIVLIMRAKLKKKNACTKTKARNKQL